MRLDTRADTICAGINYYVLSTSGGIYDVRGFHDNYDAIKDVPVTQVATVYTDGNEATYILIINEALYFGSSMDHSLINPNQIRNFGIPVFNNPYDEGRDLGINHQSLFVPFRTQGSTVFLKLMF